MEEIIEEYGIAAVIFAVGATVLEGVSRLLQLIVGVCA